ncbi:hypothetical protein BACCAP_01019 [Pseudoflavonifractor capillosus ATCC 29799]|uniref:Uncharacterized protein n=1 Tax=Pseudoflavonifractor capillosus ATCC 29799 TaxID=411467 RepID=A6NS40_9FIRM|nr:hypothetical protein BACCAP_01019 [Pseudoflavonifractor capillosus ATCC 29799]
MADSSYLKIISIQLSKREYNTGGTDVVSLFGKNFV